MFFEKLNRLALQSPLVMAVTADCATGLMTLVITPRVDKDTTEPALRQPLALSATPAEFDLGFYDALERYSASRQSLIEQVEATTEVLDAAKNAQVDKATKATARTGKPAPKQAPATAGGDAERTTAGEAESVGGGDAKDDMRACGGGEQSQSLFG